MNQLLVGLLVGLITTSGWSKDVVPYSLELVKKAESGDVEAQYLLGRSYDKGKGVAQDYKEAAKWYKKAAEHGSADAQSNLGYCYETGKEAA